MIYASSKDRFKRELDGIQVELQATDPTEMGLDVIRSRSGWVKCYATAGVDYAKMFIRMWAPNLLFMNAIWW